MLSLRNALIFSAVTAATLAYPGNSYADESASAAPAAAPPAPAADAAAVGVPVAEAAVDAAPAPVPITTPHEHADLVPRTVYDEKVGAIDKALQEVRSSYDGLSKHVISLTSEDSTLGLIGDALRADIEYLRKLKEGSEGTCRDAVVAWREVPAKRDALDTRLREQLAAADANTDLKDEDRSTTLRGIHASYELSVSGLTQKARGLDDQCHGALNGYKAAAADIHTRIAQNLARRGGFALEASVGYERYGFNQGAGKNSGANLGHASVGACYDAVGVVEVCGEAGFIFGGQSRIVNSLDEDKTTVPVGPGYQTVTSVDGEKVTETRPQWTGALRVLSRDLAPRSDLVDLHVGGYVRGLLGEEETTAYRTRTSQLTDAATGATIGDAHRVTDEKGSTRNYTEFVPGATLQLGIGSVFGQVNAGYAPRVKDVVVGSSAGFKLDF